MNNRIGIIAIALFLLLAACGENSTGPSQVDLTPSVLSVSFTGDSSAVLSEGNILTKGNGTCETTITWTICPESTFANYILYRSETAGIQADSSMGMVLGVFPDANSNQYIDTDVLWDNEYFYALKTQDENYEGVWSNEVSITTPGNQPTPSLLSCELSGRNALLEWTTCPDSDFYSYRLFRSYEPNIQDDTTFAETVYTGGTYTDTLFTDSTVSIGSEYYYALLTTNISGFSSWSNEDSVTVLEDLPTVFNLALDPSSTGRTVQLTWSPLSCEVDGYQVFFKEEESGSWILYLTTIDPYAEITATCAGYYSVRGFIGEVVSEDFAEAVNTMPSIIDITFTIYDNFSSPANPSAFIFGETAGQTGMAPNANFHQDIYAYDDSKGDNDISLYSGDFGPFGNGNRSYFQSPSSGVYGSCDPDGTWYSTSYTLYTSDQVVFVKMPFASGNNAYAKMYGLSIAPDPETNNGTMVSFSYEYQTHILGLTLFTSNSQ